MKTLNLTSTLLCDDIRREDNGKVLLIGVYTTGIFFNQPLPRRRRSLWIFAIGKAKPMDFKFEYRLIHKQNKRVVLAGEGQMNFIGSDNEMERSEIELSIPIAPVEFSEEGMYAVQLRAENERWGQIIEFIVGTRSEEAQSS